MSAELEHTLNLMLRGAGLALLLLLGLRLLAPPHTRQRLLCLALILCIVAYLLSSTPYEAAHLPALPRLLFDLLDLLDCLSPGVFWLFGQSLFNDDFRWRPHSVLPLLGLLLLNLASHTAGLDESARQALILAQQLLAGGLACHVLWLAWHDQSADLVNERRSLRLWAGPGIALYILWFQIASLGEEADPAPGLVLINLLGIMLFALWFSLRLDALLALLTPQTATPLSPDPAVSSSAGEPHGDDDSRWLQRLQQAMSTDQLWRRESLSVADLASHLGLAEYRLRRLINGALGQRNFNAYLNQFRIQAACSQLADPARRRLPVLSIALDVGFASITPFNRAFKAQLGLTPSEYRRQQLGEA